MTPERSHVTSSQAAGDTHSDVAALASLDEPTRRRIYDHVRAHPFPLSRDDVADALQITRQSAAFHLDRLAEHGLLTVTFARRSGRSGPGAGRPSKLYQRSTREVSVSVPARHYDLAGQLLAGAIVEAERSGQPPREVLDRRAHDFGQTLAGEQPGPGDLDALISLLKSHGYEPHLLGADIVLFNCPFHAVAKEQAELVCGMNLHLLEGVLAGLGTTGLCACLDPAPAGCCVRLKQPDRS